MFSRRNFKSSAEAEQKDKQRSMKSSSERAAAQALFLLLLLRRHPAPEVTARRFLGARLGPLPWCCYTCKRIRAAAGRKGREKPRWKDSERCGLDHFQTEGKGRKAPTHFHVPFLRVEGCRKALRQPGGGGDSLNSAGEQSWAIPSPFLEGVGYTQLASPIFLSRLF